MNGGGLMLDNYKESQEIAYSLLMNSIKKNKLSHAYLFNANNNEFAMDFIYAFIKNE